MSVVQWSVRFDTGIAQIDIQHKHLFEVVNELVESFRIGDSHRRITKVIDFLVTYSKEHILTEEALMESHGFSGLEEHKAEHQEFMDKVFDLKRHYEAGDWITMDVTVLLADWLTYHVEKQDMEFARYIRDLETVNRIC